MVHGTLVVSILLPYKSSCFVMSLTASVGATYCSWNDLNMSSFLILFIALPVWLNTDGYWFLKILKDSVQRDWLQSDKSDIELWYLELTKILVRATNVQSTSLNRRVEVRLTFFVIVSLSPRCPVLYIEQQRTSKNGISNFQVQTSRGVV